jgi:HlyD family secretion protein
MCSQQDLDQVQAIYQRAQAAELAAAATVSQASANLESARTALGKAAIVAPIDGIVLNRYVEPGQTVAATFQTPVLFTIAEDLTQMQLKADIDEADIGRVTLGQAAHFTVDAYPAREFAAAVVAVRFAPKTVDGVVTYEAVLDVNNAEMLLRPGMTATVDIVTETRHDVWLIPNAALRFRPPPALAATRPPDQPNPNARTIWILAPGQRQPQPVHIAIGAADDRNTELRSDPLPDGTQVVVDVLQDNAAAQRGADGGS